MTHAVQSSVSLMGTINNVTFLTLLCLKLSSSIINPQLKLKFCDIFFFNSNTFPNRLAVDVKQMFGNTLTLSCWADSHVSGKTLSLSCYCHRENPQPVYTQTGVLALCKQTAPAARSLIRRRPANPIKRPFVACTVFCLKTEKVTRKKRGDRRFGLSLLFRWMLLHSRMRLSHKSSPSSVVGNKNRAMNDATRCVI